MKLVPYTVMVPEHYAALMQETEEHAEGGWAAQLTQVIDQQLRMPEFCGDGCDGLIGLLTLRDSFATKDAVAIRRAWKKFIVAHAVTVAAAAYAGDKP